MYLLFVLWIFVLINVFLGLFSLVNFLFFLIIRWVNIFFNKVVLFVFGGLLIEFIFLLLFVIWFIVSCCIKDNLNLVCDG